MTRLVMNILSAPFIILLLSLQHSACAETDSHFVSAVQFAIQESSPELIKRSQVLLRKKFIEELDAVPVPQIQPMEVRIIGNEVVFYFVTPVDVNYPMQKAVSALVQELTGKVRMRGRSSVYLAKFAQPSLLGGYLETMVDDSHSHIISIKAKSVPLRDLLKQLKAQLGSFSYLISGRCAETHIDVSLGQGSSDPVTSLITTDLIMKELASRLQLILEKKNGIYIFDGICSSPENYNSFVPSDYLMAYFGASPSYHNSQEGYPQQIVFPVPLLGH